MNSEMIFPIFSDKELFIEYLIPHDIVNNQDHIDH